MLEVQQIRIPNIAKPAMQLCAFKAENGEQREAILQCVDSHGKGQVQWRPLIDSFGASLI